MKVIKHLIIVAAATLFTQHAMAEEAYQITAKAWTAMGEKNWAQAVELADKAIAIWGPQAKAANDELKEYPSEDEVEKYANLNEIGTLLWIKGEALRQKGDEKEALAAYRLLLTKYKFAQCWDPNGWWWKPATAAQEKIEELGG